MTFPITRTRPNVSTSKHLTLEEIRGISVMADQSTICGCTASANAHANQRLLESILSTK